jgi:TonB family protein
MKEIIMNRKIALWIVFGLFIISGFVFSADYLVEFKTRFYEGSREGEVEATEFVTSSYLQPTVTATIPARFLLSEEKAQISKVFNLKDVNLIAEADLQMSANKGSISHLLRLNGKAYRMKIAIQPKKKATHQFKIGVYEQAEEKETHLMDTDVILPQQKMAVLGFENKEGKPYFLSIQVTHVAGAPPPPPPPPKPPTATSYPTSAPLPPPPPPKEIKQNKKKIEEFEKGAVRCVGEVKPPRLIKKVDPVYPEAARQARVEGSVILGTRIDTQGRVSQVMVYSSKEFSLVRAAMDAVKQWVYEPLIIEGQTKEAVFTTTVNFKLGPEETEAAEVVGGVAGGVLKAGDSVTPPRLIKKVEPKYPIEARKALIQGMVVLEVTTDEEGNVAEAKVSRSDSSLLNQASIDAVKQWKYEPLMSKGKPVRLTFYVTLTFRLR